MAVRRRTAAVGTYAAALIIGALLVAWALALVLGG